MKVYETKDIRNIGIVGHGHAGKTSLVSAMLQTAGATQRLGRVDDGSSTTDYDEDEIAPDGVHDDVRQRREDQFPRTFSLS